MAEITNKFWRGEPLRITIDFETEGLDNYVVYSSPEYDNSDNYIYSAKFSISEGNNKVNPLGVAASNTLSIKIFDTENKLSPSNTESIYYGKMVNGVKIKAEISYDGEHWTDYGIWYTKSWSSSMNNGYFETANISCEDKLNIIGNKEIPTMKVYTDINVANLIANVFYEIGLSNTEYYIDPRLSFTLPYGVAQGTKIRDFLNNVCQLMMARVIIDRNNRICVIPALLAYNNSNNITLDGTELFPISNNINYNINYNKLNVKYLKASGLIRKQLLKESYNLVSGVNNLGLKKFKDKVVVIEQVLTKYTGISGSINSLHYEGYMDGINITITTSGAMDDTDVVVEGTVYSVDDKVESINLDNATVNGAVEFTFDTQQIISDSLATALALQIKDYISTITITHSMNNTNLTPLIYTGDTITVENFSTSYNGIYKIIGVDIDFGQASYDLSLELLKIS